MFGAHQRAIRALTDAIGSKEIAADVEPAHGREKAALLAGRLAHDVSIPFGVGRHFGSQPRVKVSMTIIRRATARAWPGQHTQRVRSNIGLLLGIGGRRGDVEECAGHCDARGAVG